MRSQAATLSRSARSGIAAAWVAGCGLAGCGVEISHPENELLLPPVTVFQRHTDEEVRSVRTLDAAQYDRRLQEAFAEGRDWTLSASRIAEHFAGKRGPDGSPRAARGETRTTPTDSWVRIRVTETGWEDDSVAGMQMLVWLAPKGDGKFTVKRILQAQLCSRPGQIFYSAEPCP
ncbi:MAG: hypothetical protein HKN12_04415 [Gemmatimonadetes bacterium]|nr:hypothetical protein [Gemmatimonadota bacterium]